MDERPAAIAAIRGTLDELGLEWVASSPTLFTVSLPGTHRLRTECALEVGQHGLDLRAFVARAPEDHHIEVYRWLLQRNLKLYAVRFAIDALGDIYLTGRLSLGCVTAAEVDRLLGTVAEVADDSFDTVVGLGFVDSIRREWAWRRSRGESTANLAAFAHLDPLAGEGEPEA